MPGGNGSGGRKGAWEELPDIKVKLFSALVHGEGVIVGQRLCSGGAGRLSPSFAGSSSQRNIGRVHPGDPTPEEIHAVRLAWEGAVA